MRKKLTIFVCFIMTICLGLALSACSSSQKKTDYGTLTVENVIDLEIGKSATLNAIFSISDKAEEITYTFDGEDISIKNGEVTALVGNKSVTVTAKTAHHETTFTVTTLDYGLLTVENVIDLEVGKSATLVPTFSISDKAEEITYTFDGEDISIKNGEVTALVGNKSVTVTAKTAHHETTFIVTTLDYGTLTVENVIDLEIGKSITLVPVFSISDKAEEITYTFDGEDISIEDGVVTALVGNKSVTVTAKTAHHETTFTVSTLDYGLLTVENVIDLEIGKSATLVPTFSISDKAEEITYTFDGEDISIKNGEVTALVGNKSVTVTAKTAHHETTFIVTTLDYGTLTVDDVLDLEVGKSAIINPTFSISDKAEEITYSFEGNDISIENGVVTALVGNKTVVVTAKTTHHQATFTVTTLDYGTLSVEDIVDLEIGESASINALFSIPDKSEPITYLFEGNDISIENGVVTALVGNKTVVVTANTTHHEATFTVTTLDYGMLSVEDILDLEIGESATINALFSIPDKAEEITYTFDGEDISIKNGKVTALVENKSVTVTVKTAHHETTFTVVTVENRGELIVENTTAWVGYPAIDVYPKFTNSNYAEPVVYSCAQSGIEINGNLISVAQEGSYTVSAKTTYHSTTFTVSAKTVDTTHEWYVNNDRFNYKADTRLKKWQSEGIDNSTTIYIGDSFFDYSECWPDFETTHYVGKDAMCIGISGSKTYHWETWANGWLSKTAPKNVVMHIGTNNVSAGDTADGTFDSLKRMFTIMRHNLPNTTFYWFSITRLDETSTDILIKNNVRNTVNELMKEWCSERDYMVYVHTVDSIDGSMLRDGVHPKVEYYKIFVDAVAEAGLEVNDLPENRKGLEIINQGYGHISYNASTKTVTGGVEYVAPYRAAGFVRKDGVFYNGNFSVSGTATIKMSNAEHLATANYWVGLFVSNNYHDTWYSTSKALPLGVMVFKGGVTQIRGYYADNNLNAGSLGSVSNNTFTYKIISHNGTIVLGINNTYKSFVDETSFKDTYFGINGENCTFELTMDFVTDADAIKKDLDDTLKLARPVIGAGSLEDITFAKTEEIGKTGKAFVSYGGKQLTDNYIISGKLDIYDSDMSKPNNQCPHIHIGFGLSTADRILLYDRSLSGKYELGLPYTYSTDGTDSFVKEQGKTLTIEWMIVKVNGNAFFYLDGELRAVYTGMSKTNGLLVGSEWNDSKFYDMKALSLELDSTLYQTEIAKYSSVISQYQNQTTNNKIRV